jgi:Uma2 family endonuclease
MTTTLTGLVTAQDYARLPDDGQKSELVRGRIVTMNMPTPRHGEICVNTILLVGPSVKQHRLGRLTSNDAGILTERDPDTVRGADVAYYSFKRVPEGPLPESYLEVAPDLVFEIRSHGDRWDKIHLKVGEYLRAGVTCVCVLDDQTASAHLFHSEQAPLILKADDELHLPDILGNFRAAIRDFFA